MAGTAFGNALEFMQRLGVIDVVLPFILVFTLVFAFLEKTKVFGTDLYRTDDGKSQFQVTRKNMNSMAAFVIAFFVVASTQLVSLINKVTSQIVLVIVLVFAFMLTVGALQKESKDGMELKSHWVHIFEVISFLSIAVIFLDALGWLNLIFDFFNGFWGSEATMALVLVLILIGIMVFVMYEKKPDSNKAAKSDDS